MKLLLVTLWACRATTPEAAVPAEPVPQEASVPSAEPAPAVEPVTTPEPTSPPAAAEPAAAAAIEAPATGPTPTGLPSGAPCTAASECASGLCEGEGCDAAHPGVCAPAARACTRDLRSYCGCDGSTFQTSGSCPGRRFAHRGPC